MVIEMNKEKVNFKNEGNMDFYRIRYSEARSFSKMGDKGGLKRIMYEIKKE